MVFSRSMRNCYSPLLKAATSFVLSPLFTFQKLYLNPVGIRRIVSGTSALPFKDEELPMSNVVLASAT
jgi:hypothetical protein